MSALILLLNVVLEVLTKQGNQARKKKKSIQTEKENVKLPLFVDNMSLYTENRPLKKRTL